MEDLVLRFGDEPARKRYRHMSAVAQWSFNQLFWNEKVGCLCDAINGGPPDPSIRPNQIFAVSLPHSMLRQDRARSVVEKVQEHLLTPFGLRSLAPSDPQYCGDYTGGPTQRDGTYRQGTVWSWLLGPFITAYIRVNGGSEEARRQAQAWLSPFESHLAEAGLGHVSEIFEGDAPHRPCGCIAQAWSVAEILRVYFDEVRGRRPNARPTGSPVQSKNPPVALGPLVTRDVVWRNVGKWTRIYRASRC